MRLAAKGPELVILTLYHSKWTVEKRAPVLLRMELVFIYSSIYSVTIYCRSIFSLALVILRYSLNFTLLLAI